MSTTGSRGSCGVPFLRRPLLVRAGMPNNVYVKEWQLFLDSIVLGAYPSEMSEIFGSRLPTFSSNDKLNVESSLDFIGINHYTSLDVVPIGQPTAITDIYITPHSLENIVLQVMERYNNTPMIITKNGYGQRSNNSQSSKDFLHDEDRIGFLTSYLTSLYNVIRSGVEEDLLPGVNIARRFTRSVGKEENVLFENKGKPTYRFYFEVYGFNGDIRTPEKPKTDFVLGALLPSPLARTLSPGPLPVVRTAGPPLGLPPPDPHFRWLHICLRDSHFDSSKLTWANPV
ncbi:Beta-glucosidase 18 [Platanthera zijinensis]|uniref:Beta-glucosidase 18 n=1 Tax=Platanthera zijinensis TaxID=2320716 RepID=A0AAP0B9H4_9ASPA